MPYEEDKLQGLEPTKKKKKNNFPIIGSKGNY